jgi:DNA repair protein RadA/Sms
LEIREPAADLGVLAAVLSSVRNTPIDPGWAFFGEVGLGGEVRSVPQAEKRLQELARLGFTRAVLPRASVEALSGKPLLETAGLTHVGALAEMLLPSRAGRRNPV